MSNKKLFHSMNKSAVSTWPFGGHPTLANDIRYYYKLDTDWSMIDSIASADWVINWATFTSSWKINWAYNWDWTNDYALFNHSAINTVNNFTLNFWFKNLWGSLSYFKWFRWELTASNYKWWHFYVSWAETWFRKANSNTTLEDTKFSNTTLNDLGYHMITVRQSSTTWCEVKIDNVVVKTEAWFTADTLLNLTYNNSVLWANYYNTTSNTSNFSNVSIDEDWFWERTLTDSEITDLHNWWLWLQY